MPATQDLTVDETTVYAKEVGGGGLGLMGMDRMDVAHGFGMSLTSISISCMLMCCPHVHRGHRFWGRVTVQNAKRMVAGLRVIL